MSNHQFRACKSFSRHTHANIHQHWAGELQYTSFSTHSHQLNIDLTPVQWAISSKEISQFGVLLLAMSVFLPLLLWYPSPVGCSCWPEENSLLSRNLQVEHLKECGRLLEMKNGNRIQHNVYIDFFGEQYALIPLFIRRTRRSMHGLSRLDPLTIQSLAELCNKQADLIYETSWCV